jgi:SAM-dependent methyltransferase
MPEPVDLWALCDLCTPWCLHVAATLRIAEHIQEGKAEIDQLAAAAGCDAHTLHCMLGHLVSRGVFEEPRPGRFALNDLARRLLDPGMRLSLDLEGFGGRMAHTWSTMLDYVRTGEPAYHKIFGRPYWDDLEANPRIAAEFDDLMGPAGHGTPSPDFEIEGGWSGVRHVIDVGGGTGAMLAELLRARPGVRGTLVDLPATVARSGSLLAEMADRVAVSGQSFFDPLPRGADLYLLRGVINDWPDREAEAILRRCAEAARPSGRIVVLKSVQPDGTPRRLFIEMILCGGRPRTLSEFRDLAARAGLEVVAAGRQPSYFVVECRPTVLP